MTCSPAAGFAGLVEKIWTAATQVSALFGAATPGSYSVSGETVAFTGSPSDWSLRRIILDNAHLCAAVGGFDAWLIGTGMPGRTFVAHGAWSSYHILVSRPGRVPASDVSTA